MRTKTNNRQTDFTDKAVLERQIRDWLYGQLDGLVTNLDEKQFEAYYEAVYQDPGTFRRAVEKVFEINFMATDNHMEDTLGGLLYFATVRINWYQLQEDIRDFYRQQAVSA